jgi:transcriptional regulator with XRE-family HTH domain
MAKNENEQLRRYIKQTMESKGLLAREVAERSGKAITTGYVNSLMTGRAANPSVSKLKALARGLGVAVEELLMVAYGIDETQDKRASVDPKHTLTILDLMKKVALNPDIEEILQKVVHLSPEERAVLLNYLKALSGDKDIDLLKEKRG